ncbi:MAG: hypothetical protein KF903_01740 [Dokdonella sp.]|nr:hypothetical protein [Dokdonella sp.]
MSFSRDEASLAQAERLDGKLLLITNTTVAPAVVVSRYKASLTSSAASGCSRASAILARHAWASLFFWFCRPEACAMRELSSTRSCRNPLSFFSTTWRKVGL